MISTKGDIASRIILIGQRSRELDQSLAAITIERARHSLAATEGDREALNKIGDLDHHAGQIEREQLTLGAALEQLEEMRKEQLRAEAEKAIKAREAEARKIADQILECCTQIDERMAELTKLFERRSDLLRLLGSTNTAPSSYLLRLQQKFGPTCAARAAKLQNFISIEHVPVAQVCGLRASARALEGTLVASERGKSKEYPGETP